MKLCYHGNHFNHLDCSDSLFQVSRKWSKALVYYVSPALISPALMPEPTSVLAYGSVKLQNLKAWSEGCWKCVPTTQDNRWLLVSAYSTKVNLCVSTFYESYVPTHLTRSYMRMFALAHSIKVTSECLFRHYKLQMEVWSPDLTNTYKKLQSKHILKIARVFCS